MHTLFAILPYIRTEEAFPVAGITFRDSHDTAKLTPDEIDHLQKITSLFYLSEEKPVEAVVYAVLGLPDDRVGADALVQQLRRAHTILTFLVTNERLYDTYEQLTMYLAVPQDVFPLEEASFVPGYGITVNWLDYCEIAPGTKLYPPKPYPFLFIPKGRSISGLQFLFESNYLLYGLERFVRGNNLNQPEEANRLKTILRAMQWYNRSFSEFDSEEEKVIHLAVAFETLLHEPGAANVRIRDELKSHLRGLFGEAAGLSTWVDQFYDERSRVLHEGFAATLRFVAGDKNVAERRLLLDSLVSYGGRLLRMCIFNILHATLLAEDANLNAWFVHEETRLQDICKGLNNGELTAEQRLASVLRLVFDLETYRTFYSGQREVALKTVHAVGKKLIRTYLEAHPDTELGIRQRLQAISNMGVDNPTNLRHAYLDLHTELRRGLGTCKGKYWPRESFQALAHFAEYASSLHFHT